MTGHQLITVWFSLAIISLPNPPERSEAFVQNEIKKDGFGQVIIEGKIIEGCRDTVTLFFQKEFVFNYVGREKYQQVCDINGNFKFSLNITHPAKASLFLNGDVKILFSNFYIMPGDIVSAIFTKGKTEKIIFSGGQVEEFNCMYALDTSRKNILQNPPPRPLMISYSADSVINEMIRSCKSSSLYGDYFYNILSKYKKKMRPEIYSLLQADIEGNVNLSKCFIFLESLEQASTKRRKEIDQLFTKEFYKAKEKFRDSLIVYSEHYIDFLLRFSQVKLKIRSKNGKYSMKDMIRLIENDYDQLLRDRLLTYYLLSPKIGVDNAEYEFCLRKTLDKINSRFYKTYIVQQLEKFSKGSQAYNFSLPDTTGKYISLSDFRGKVVLVDFWFTGCSACTHLSAHLEKEVIPNFIDSPVVFISVSLDKEKTEWIKSINSGRYTSAYSINLYTDGMGFENKLISNYNIQGCPFLLLIDKEGKIVSASPAWEPLKLTEEIKATIENNSRPN
ncbi:MAG: TlpA disulfide reductase family protein [Ginsengibacter sp.]